MAKKKLNKKATIKNILDKANRSIGISIDTVKFNEKAKAKDGEKFIKEAAVFCEVDIVYL